MTTSGEEGISKAKHQAQCAREFLDALRVFEEAGEVLLEKWGNLEYAGIGAPAGNYPFTDREGFDTFDDELDAIRKYRETCRKALAPYL